MALVVLSVSPSAPDVSVPSGAIAPLPDDAQIVHTDIQAPTLGGDSGNVAPLAEAGPDQTANLSVPVTLDGAASYDPDRTGLWTTALPLPLPIRSIRGSAATWGNAIYVFGGATDTIASNFRKSLNTTWRFDLTTESWEEKSPFPGTGGWNIAAVSIPQGILILVGIRGNSSGASWSNQTFFYDPAFDEWTPRADTPCFAPEVATLWDSVVYALSDSAGWFCAYRPATDQWTLLAPWEMTTPSFWGKNGGTLAAVAGKVYADGGLPLDPNLGIYDPVTDHWTIGPDMITPRFDHSVAALHDRIYAIGGQRPFTSQNENEEFDPINGTWASREPMPTPRDEAAIATVGDSLHVIGGSLNHDDFAHADNWQLTTHEVYTVRLDYAWDFGDGTNATGKTANHSYAAPGVYTVTLTVTDLKGGVGTDTLTVTILSDNQPPVANAGGAYTAAEGYPLTFDASASTDPDGDVLSYRWDFESDGTWDTPASPDPTATHVWGDDYSGLATVEVSDATHAVTATAAVLVSNVAPAIDDLQVYAAVDLTLRVAGEKFHDVCLELSQNGGVSGSACVVRMPGSPDRQTATLAGERIDLLGDTAITLTYTPDDDPVNGQRNGANPVWVDLTFADGSTVRLHHIFNVQHPDTWTWTLDDLRPLLVGKPITFEFTASDPGSDDLTATVDFGDGGSFTATLFNDGIGPDPFPSPDVNPITADFTATHAYAVAGTYSVTVAVEDDDGGLDITTLSVVL